MFTHKVIFNRYFNLDIDKSINIYMYVYFNIRSIIMTRIFFYTNFVFGACSSAIDSLQNGIVWALGLRILEKPTLCVCMALFCFLI